MKRDDIFQRPLDQVSDFVFDERVASIFDDMVERSIPLYAEVQNLVTELGRHYLRSGGVIYDIGCSTGTTLAALLNSSKERPKCHLIGIEPSKAMADRAGTKLQGVPGGDRVEIINKRIEDFQELENASLVIMLYTLQFIRPIRRQQVMNMIFQSLKDGGMLLWGEKILSDSSLLSRLFIDTYHSRKLLAGYTDSEISQKREALENVLVPYRDSENRLLLEHAGFTVSDTVLRWCNFCLYVGVKV